MALGYWNMSFPPPPSPVQTGRFTHDVFFGELQSRCSLNGNTLSHRIAVGSPEEIKVHMHLEAHFLLVTNGRYVSSAKAIPNLRATLIYNPPGTTHLDHFKQGKGSFFTVSVSTARLAESAEAELLPTAVHRSYLTSYANSVYLCTYASGVQGAEWNSLKPRPLPATLVAI